MLGDSCLPYYIFVNASPLCSISVLSGQFKCFSLSMPLGYSTERVVGKLQPAGNSCPPSDLIKTNIILSCMKIIIHLYSIGCKDQQHAVTGRSRNQTTNLRSLLRSCISYSHKRRLPTVQRLGIQPLNGRKLVTHLPKVSFSLDFPLFHFTLNIPVIC